MRRLVGAALSSALIVAAVDAEAHAFGARYDLPLPLGFYLAAAGAAVALSFLGALAFFRRGHTRTIALELTLAPWIGLVLGGALLAVGVAVVALVVAAAFWGPPEAVRNLATVGVWVIWWVGFLLFSALVIGLWRWLDPFRTVAGVALRIAGRPWVRAADPPVWTGLLAPAGLLCIGWIELVSDWSEDPRAVGVMIATYAAISVLGAFSYGEAWFHVADPLARVFSLLARTAPLAVPGGSVVVLRVPGEGLLQQQSRPRGEAGLVICLIGIVLFDGLSETPAWAAVLDFVSESQTMRPALLWLRDQGIDLLKAIRSAGLFAMIATFFAAYWALVTAMRQMTGSHASTAMLARDFAATLLPIAVAYHLSHYVSYFLIAGQLALSAVSDPFALGWDIIGTRDRSIDITVIGTEQIWWIAFTALICGHGLSVLIGHRRALQIFGDTRLAATSQFPMMIAMVGLTVLSLWILSQPITE